MKKLLVIISIIFLMNSCTKEESAEITSEAQKTEMEVSALTIPINKEEEIENAKSAIKMFAGALKSELKKAIEEGGPVNAISVCNTKALSITRKISEEEGLNLGRVSLKNRNPKNAPNEWQRKALEDFEIRKSKGEAVESMTYSDIIEQKDGKQFRFMKAIPTGEVCILCHGANIAPEVMIKLKELYPNDKATGFKIGDIRGAFVVTKEFPR
jgi:hypothetical protein